MVAAIKRRILISPLALVASGLSAIICFVVTILKMDRGYLAYSMIGLGCAAGLLQWWYCRQEIIRTGVPARNSIVTQIYGLVIFTGLCSAPALILGRAITGQNLWSGG